ncbi:MAG: hypothetical protein WBK94_03235 [Tenuifilaceae bacterium]|jgi:hypothetical protein|nr:MAG: hypothetical protein BWX49_00746 [Bacteroidetes bacterium ADurb.Bin008]HPK86378.1 hypothetical protein [Bacilli bacterium]
MNIAYKILLFSILSISLPIGKLFEIFIWNDRITKTEIVFEKQRFESDERVCYFVTLAKEIQKKLSIYFQDRLDFAIIERITNNKNTQTLSIQKNKINRIKTLLIRRFLFNILYLDDSEFELRLFL